jgi:haloacetate dehalogenase
MINDVMITPLDTDDTLFPGFELVDIAVPGSSVRARIGGKGPPLLLLHGYPQTHVMWHKVVERLRDRFTLICADLRGYGGSAKPPGDAEHSAYSKRVMADDLVVAMRALGHERWFVGSHDRGARVAHRMALDHPDRVRKLAVLDIAPTREMYAGTTQAFARAYWHWFYLILPAPVPETMIGADPDMYWLKKCGAGAAGLTPFAPEALQAYLDAFRDPAAIHASCEDYRAAASIDIAHDDAYHGRKVTCPLLALWGEHGVVNRCFDVLDLWRRRANDVRGHTLPGGHYLAEELPDDVATTFAQFFGEA